MKLSNSFSETLRTFLYFQTSGTHYQLNGIEHLDLFGEWERTIEHALALLTNVIELNNENILNAKFVEKRAIEFICSYCNHEFEVTLPCEIDKQNYVLAPVPKALI